MNWQQIRSTWRIYRFVQGWVHPSKWAALHHTWYFTTESSNHKNKRTVLWWCFIYVRRKSGVAKKNLDEEPRALYTHCYGHALSLACSDAIKGCKLIRNALDASYEIVNLIKKSPRRDALLQKLKAEMPESSPGIRVLCPTRWTVRAQALQSIITNYEALQELC